MAQKRNKRRRKQDNTIQRRSFGPTARALLVAGVVLLALIMLATSLAGTFVPQ